MLDRFPVARTRDPDEFREVLIRILGGRGCEFPEGTAGFEVRANRYRLNALELVCVAFSRPTELDFPAAATVRQQFYLSGTGQVQFGTATGSIDKDRSCVISPGLEVRAGFGAETRQLFIRIDEAALAGKLAALIGGLSGRPLRFDSMADLRSEGGERLRRHVFAFAEEINASSAGLPEMLLAEYQQVLMIQFLLSNRNTYSHLLDRPSPLAAPWQVRAVEEFIEANWAQPITIEALAAETGASARGIFKAFRSSRGYTPMSFLKTVRLRKARELLQRADAATTVTGVALACGFQNVGRFAAAYRRQFNELPSATTNRAKSVTAGPSSGTSRT